MTYTEDFSEHELGDETGETEDDPRKVTLSRSQIRALERDARDARSAKRELAFIKAGIATDTDLGQLFMRAYEGDLDPALIRTEWEKVAPKPAPANETEETTPPVATTNESSDVSELRRQLATGGVADTGAEPVKVIDPREEALRLGNEHIEGGGAQDEAMAIAFSRLAQAAAEGDERVIWRP